MTVGSAPSAAALAIDPSIPRTLAYEPALDGLRGISIAGVTLFHACATSGLVGWVRGGALGVSVFFTLSGFLITTLLLREHAARGRIDLRRFWARRIRRLAPASLTVVAAVVVLSRTPLLELRAREAIATTWSYMNWNIVAAGDDELLHTVVGPLGPTWSLAVEEQFYVLLAIAVGGLLHVRQALRTLTALFLAVIVAALVAANTVSDWHPRLEFGTDVRAAELAAGALLALAVQRWGAGIASWVRTIDAVGALALAGIAVLFVTADYTPPWLLRGGFAAVAVVSCAVIVAALARGRVAAALSAAPLVALGRWSYALYLVHWPAFLALSEERVGVDRAALVALKLAVAIVLAVALHRAVEQPLRRVRGVRLVPTLVAWLGASLLVTVLAVVVAG